MLCCRVPDAIPKKRGPKTDVLEALLRRVDGLEQKLKEKKAEPVASSSKKKAQDADDEASPTNGDDSSSASADPVTTKLQKIDTSHGGPDVDESAIYSPPTAR